MIVLSNPFNCPVTSGAYRSVEYHVQWNFMTAGYCQTVQMMVCPSYWLGHLRINTVTFCSMIHVALSFGNWLRTLLANKSVFPYDFHVLCRMRYFT
jgi:hypothetical protein